MDLLIKVKVLSAEVSHAPDSYSIQSKRLIKVKRIIKIKRHRKKRINKKLNKNMDIYLKWNLLMIKVIN